MQKQLQPLPEKLADLVNYKLQLKNRPNFHLSAVDKFKVPKHNKGGSTVFFTFEQFQSLPINYSNYKITACLGCIPLYQITAITAD